MNGVQVSEVTGGLVSRRSLQRLPLSLREAESQCMHTNRGWTCFGLCFRGGIILVPGWRIASEEAVLEAAEVIQRKEDGVLNRKPEERWQKMVRFGKCFEGR